MLTPMFGDSVADIQMTQLLKTTLGSFFETYLADLSTNFDQGAETLIQDNTLSNTSTREWLLSMVYGNQ